MSSADGILRRLTRKLTEDPEQLDAEELTEEVATTGANRAIDCRQRCGTRPAARRKVSPPGCGYLRSTSGVRAARSASKTRGDGG